MKCSVTNGFSIRVICIEPQMKSTIALTLCHSRLLSVHVWTLTHARTHAPRETHARARVPFFSSFFVYHPHPEDLLQGHSSNCAYKVKDCCQYPCIIPTYGTHSRVKYTWPHEIYMAVVCTAVAHMIRRPSRNSHICCWKMLTVVAVHLPRCFKIVFQYLLKRKTL